ncbi:AcrR family transcriptional regulator [Rhizobium sp. SG_E_25_P2]|uniref:TetR/AcrR family transcriptional regulator n=1 Tax=Rhizobium sp. SG_E_25_P2 TaxID=2879942 RepID=UPI002475469B|nr:TetR/AcrR family transcriptional regulator [Rhizobium sp. SG_E_25_P2]MDH6269209.1 AcrR family transcriptional regulator [Rhizobium sp. SG_E_25_P2]
MVEAILEAGARILSGSGWAGFNTNAVAELAGVSIGSLYQYFPDKLALIDAIRDQHLQDCLIALRGLPMDAVRIEDFAAALVDALISAHGRHPGLHRVLLDEVPSGGHLDPASAFETEYIGIYAHALGIFAGRALDEKSRADAMVLSDAVDGVIHNAARRGQLSDGFIRAALILLVETFLSRLRQPDDKRASG